MFVKNCLAEVSKNVTVCQKRGHLGRFSRGHIIFLGVDPRSVPVVACVYAKYEVINVIVAKPNIIIGLFGFI